VKNIDKKSIIIFSHTKTTQKKSNPLLNGCKKQINLINTFNILNSYNSLMY